MTTDDNERWDDFWGDEPEWPTASIPVTRTTAPEPDSGGPTPATGSAGSDDTGSSGLFRRRTDVVGTGQIPITRQHRRVDAGSPVAGSHVTEQPDDQPAPIGAAFAETRPAEIPSDRTGPVWDREWRPVARSAWRDIDPRLFRLGAVAVLVTLLIPLIVGFRSNGDDDAGLVATAESEPTTDALLAATVPTTEPVFVEVPSSTAPLPSEASTASAASADTSAESAVPSTESVTSAPSTEDTAAAAPPDGAEELSAAALAEQRCPVDYDVQEGDFWIRLADGAGVDLGELLDANDATIDTPLYPGRTICLPAGATTPPPPPAITAAPQPSSSGSGGSSGSRGNGGASTPSTAAPRPTPTSPPTTAAPPTTEAPPPTSPAPAEIERIIRSVWPDDLEDRALEIAWRESGYRANVRNYCCLGLFQIYWSVHKSWLAGLGITASNQLYDAETNARAALALYERSGGWGPWGG